MRVNTAAAAANDLLPFHRLSSHFPLLNGAEFEELAADIAANDLREPITLYDGAVLDGRNRYRACLNRKIEPRFETFGGTEAEALAFVISKNIRRRQLSRKEKQEALAKLVAAQPEKSDRQLAKETGVTHPTIAKARREAVATGKALPVEKRVGADGRTCKPPTRTVPKVKPSPAITATSEVAAPDEAVQRFVCQNYPNAELDLLREFARFVIGRTRVSTDPKDHPEWKTLLGRVKQVLSMTNGGGPYHAR